MPYDLQTVFGTKPGQVTPEEEFNANQRARGADWMMRQALMRQDDAKTAAMVQMNSANNAAALEREGSYGQRSANERGMFDAQQTGLNNRAGLAIAPALIGLQQQGQQYTDTRADTEPQRKLAALKAGGDMSVEELRQQMTQQAMARYRAANQAAGSASAEPDQMPAAPDNGFGHDTGALVVPDTPMPGSTASQVTNRAKGNQGAGLTSLDNEVLRNILHLGPDENAGLRHRIDERIVDTAGPNDLGELRRAADAGDLASFHPSDTFDARSADEIVKARQIIAPDIQQITELIGAHNWDLNPVKPQIKTLAEGILNKLQAVKTSPATQAILLKELDSIMGQAVGKNSGWLFGAPAGAGDITLSAPNYGAGIQSAPAAVGTPGYRGMPIGGGF